MKKHTRVSARPFQVQMRSRNLNNRSGSRSNKTYGADSVRNGNSTVVGVGASAGGLEAFTQLLKALPADTGMAFVLVQHLERAHETILSRILARVAKMPVAEAHDRLRIEPNHVYVIPANADLSLSDGRLRLAARKTRPDYHGRIDRFFQSLAATQHEHTIGVILSGIGSDGADGLKAVKQAGGVTFAQQPESAKFGEMPRAAIAAGCVDVVTTPDRMAAEIVRIAQSPLHATPTASQIGQTPVPRALISDWDRLFRLMRSTYGADFSLYKKSTIGRRVARRMALNRIDSIHRYVKFLESNPKESAALYHEILIKVTEFFRDPEVFTALKSKIFPRLLRGRNEGEPIRIWVAGCSNGEEAYSIAITLTEYLDANSIRPPIQIFATDINDDSIERARAGVYPAHEIRKISAQRLQRYFVRIDDSFQVKQELRDLCVFARHDVTKDPPFSRLDLISCRNVLIYFESILQKRALAAFHYGLNRGGVLIIGKSENLGASADLFTIIDRNHKFFAKNATVVKPVETVREIDTGQPPFVKYEREVLPGIDLEKEADRIVWQRYGHAGLVINNDLQILHFRGDLSSFLRPSPGRATFHLLRMLPPELEMESRAAIEEARKSRRTVRRAGIALKDGRRERLVNFEIRPLPKLARRGEQYFLILFEDASHQGEPSPAPATAQTKDRRIRDREIVRLRDELERTRDYVQAVIREQEAANEELKTGHEETLSSMEELQSANEELETAKEELQSSNEELAAVNEQLQNRNIELSRLSDDMGNLLSSVEFPIVILDQDRRIRRFTPAAEKIHGLKAKDIGRPIVKSRIGLEISDLEELIDKVAESDSEVTRELQHESSRWYYLRVRSFRDASRRADGFVMTFVDIDELKRKEMLLQKERNFIAAILNAARDLLVVVLSPDGRIEQFNRACQKLTGYALADVKGRPIVKLLLPPEALAVAWPAFRDALEGKRSEAQHHWVAKDGRRLLINWSNTAVKNEAGAVEAVIATGVDQTGREAAEERAHESAETIRALMETAGQAILAFDRQGRIMLANSTTNEMFGYRPSELNGAPIDKLIAPSARSKFATFRLRWFMNPVTQPIGRGFELAGWRRDESEFPLELGLSALHTSDGLVGIGFFANITERKKGEAALKDYQEQLRRLTASLLQTQESENKEFARELHDALSQELAAIGLEISHILKSPKADGALAEPLEQLGKRVARLTDEIHRMSRQLHPAVLDELGLTAALRSESNNFSTQRGIPVRCDVRSFPRNLPPDVALCLYRVTQESLHNIRKHSGAKSVNIQLHGLKGGVKLRIADTGDGFDVNEARKRGGLGLVSMEERVRLVNGDFAIHSSKNEGTLVEVFVPRTKNETNTHRARGRSSNRN